MPTTDATLATAALSALDRAGIRWALLHGAAPGAEGFTVGSDLDLVIDRAPRDALALLDGSARATGLRVIAEVRYDPSPSASVFLVDEAASEGAHLDLLYDPDGIGRHGVRSDPLLRSAVVDAGITRVAPPHALVYEWWKRWMKGDLERLRILQARAAELPRGAVRAAARELGATDGLPDAIRAPLPDRLEPVDLRAVTAANLRRAGRRLVRPAGCWVHRPGADADAGRALARRFGRILEHSGGGAVPAGLPGQLRWFAQTVQPVRTRAGVFVSTGSRPALPGLPDVVVEEHSEATCARAVVEAMNARVLR